MRETGPQHLSAAHGGSFQRRAAVQLLRVLVREVSADDITGMAAEMAYRFLFAIFPLLLLLTTSLGYVGDALGLDNLLARALLQIEPFLPGTVFQFVQNYVAGLLETRSSAFLTLGLLGTIWGAAGGIGTLIKALDRAYDVAQPRPFWKQQLLAISVTVMIPLTALGLVGLTVLAGMLTGWLGDAAGPAPVLTALVALARWPVLASLLFFALSAMYWLLPSVRPRYLRTLPGSAVATAGWLLLSQLFGLYVANFGHFDATYGGFGAIIIFLLWLYLTGIVVLVGAEINAVLDPGHRRRLRLDLPAGQLPPA